jgi:hypothetical protein
MALPKSYFTSVKNLEAVLAAVRSAQAPYKFNRAFLESLELNTNADRLIIGVLKSLGFLDEGGRPTQRYFDYLDPTQSEFVMADAIRNAYADLFKLNITANEMTKKDVISKLKMLSQGKISESVLNKMAMTFTALVRHADFSSARQRKLGDDLKLPKENHVDGENGPNQGNRGYKLQIVLPESRDQAVYDALFQSLRKHLF